MVGSDRIFSRTAEIWLDKERILHVRLLKDAEVELADVDENFEIYRKLGCEDNKVLQLLEAETVFLFSAEARARAAKLGGRFFIASAIISKSLGTRLIVNFFLRFNKPDVPFKMFPDEESALAWLRSFQHKKKQQPLGVL